MPQKRSKGHQGNGQHAPAPPLFEIPSAARVEPDPEPLRVREKHALLRDAKAWATENGLMGELEIGEPSVMIYPVRGHGYTLTLHELDGLKRTATARYTAAHARDYWTMDVPRR